KTGSDSRPDLSKRGRKEWPADKRGLRARICADQKKEGERVDGSCSLFSVLISVSSDPRKSAHEIRVAQLHGPFFPLALNGGSCSKGSRKSLARSLEGFDSLRLHGLTNDGTRQQHGPWDAEHPKGRAVGEVGVAAFAHFPGTFASGNECSSSGRPVVGFCSL